MGWTTTREKFLQRRFVETTGCKAAKLQGNDFAPQHVYFPSESFTEHASSLHAHAISYWTRISVKLELFITQNPFPSQGAAFLCFGNSRKTQELAAKRNISPKSCSQHSEEWPKSLLSGPFQKQNFSMPMSQLEVLFSRQAQLSCWREWQLWELQ